MAEHPGLPSHGATTYADDSVFRSRFETEAHNAAGLHHTGVAQVFDFGSGDPEHPPYLVMEYVDGQPLPGDNSGPGNGGDNGDNGANGANDNSGPGSGGGDDNSGQGSGSGCGPDDGHSKHGEGDQ